MADKKQSQFTEVSTVEASDYIPVFGNGSNEKISKINFFKQINDETDVFIYPTIEQLQSANLVADIDFPHYVRLEQTGYKLYKITSVAPGDGDISLNNGTTATLQDEDPAGPSPESPLPLPGTISVRDNDGDLVSRYFQTTGPISSSNSVEYVVVTDDANTEIMVRRPLADFKYDLNLSSLTIFNFAGSDYYLNSSDLGKYIRFISSSSKNIVIETQSENPQAIGSVWNFRNANTTDVNITSSVGVTVNVNYGGTLAFPDGGTISIVKVAENEYDVFGQTVGA